MYFWTGKWWRDCIILLNEVKLKSYKPHMWYSFKKKQKQNKNNIGWCIRLSLHKKYMKSLNNLRAWWSTLSFGGNDMDAYFGQRKFGCDPTRQDWGGFCCYEGKKVHKLCSFIHITAVGRRKEIATSAILISWNINNFNKKAQFAYMSMHKLNMWEIFNFFSQKTYQRYPLHVQQRSCKISQRSPLAKPNHNRVIST